MVNLIEIVSIQRFDFGKANETQPIPQNGMLSIFCRYLNNSITSTLKARATDPEWASLRCKCHSQYADTIGAQTPKRSYPLASTPSLAESGEYFLKSVSSGANSAHLIGAFLYSLTPSFIVKEAVGFTHGRYRPLNYCISNA